MEKREVEVIPSTKLPQRKDKFFSKRVVAAYARVSSNKVEQENSLEAQVAYFNYYILSHKSWTLYKVYIDDGISGMKKEARKAFMQMIEDALAGKFDLILTKSISRFARNTVDTLNTIRELKDKGVEVFFEKENISTFDSKSEFILTLMGSFAQEESRSISENIVWGVRRYYANGNYNIHTKAFIGYDKTVDGKYVVNEEDARIIRYIFYLALLGEPLNRIANILNKLNVPSPMNKSWCSNVIGSILSNEKYKGDALTQKKFTIDYLTGKNKINEGELPQYYITDGHPAIIDRKTFDYLQELLQSRKECEKIYVTNASLTTIVCGVCGRRFGIKTSHSNDKYKKYFWRCNGYYVNNCHAPTIDVKRMRDEVNKTLQKWIKEKYTKIVLEEMQNIIDDVLFTRLVALLESGSTLKIDDESIRILVKKVVVRIDKSKKLIFLNDSEEIYQV